MLLFELFFAVYARKTVKQNAKGNKKSRCRKCKKGRTGGEKERGKREGLKGCTRIIIITLVLVLSEIMSWQGLLQVFTGATTNLDIGWWQF